MTGLVYEVSLVAPDQIDLKVDGWVGLDEFTNTAARSWPGLLGQSSQKIRPLEKKLGRKPATPPNQMKKCSKNLCMQITGPIFANYC